MFHDDLDEDLRQGNMFLANVRDTLQILFWEELQTRNEEQGAYAYNYRGHDPDTLAKAHQSAVYAMVKTCSTEPAVLTVIDHFCGKNDKVANQSFLKEGYERCGFINNQYTDVFGFTNKAAIDPEIHFDPARFVPSYGYITRMQAERERMAWLMDEPPLVTKEQHLAMIKNKIVLMRNTFELIENDQFARQTLTQCLTA